MACQNCGSGGCSTGGCGKSGGCSTGSSCNKLNTFDWLAFVELPEQANLDIIEVGFKNNARKEFYRKPHYIHVSTGDYVVVESAAGGYDIGRVSLSGELVRLQMKKKRVRDNAILPAVVRLANERDIERLEEARSCEQDTLVQARAIARSLNLEMKIGDVEYQGDKRKVTFYYTADGRVDFRELIRVYAREFKVKIEMRQIGARQESARIGGIGACGRELCCSTWLSDFKSVSTVAARYQNLAINQSKLSGQCGRLKCCLNYELKSYLDALRDFPRQLDRLETQRGTAILIKTDIFKRLMFFGYQQHYGVADIQPLSVEQARAIGALNAQGKKPADLNDISNTQTNEETAAQQSNADASSNDNKKQRGNQSRLHRKISMNNSAMELDEPVVLPELEQKERNKRRRSRRGGGNNNQNQNTGNEQQQGNNQPRNNEGNQNPPQQRGTPRPPKQQGNNQQQRTENGQQQPPQPRNAPKQQQGNNQPRNNEGNNGNQNPQQQRPKRQRPPQRNTPKQHNNEQQQGGNNQQQQGNNGNQQQPNQRSNGQQPQQPRHNNHKRPPKNHGKADTPPPPPPSQN